MQMILFVYFFIFVILVLFQPLMNTTNKHYTYSSEKLWCKAQSIVLLLSRVLYFRFNLLISQLII